MAVKYRIDDSTGVSLLVVALLFDVLSVIPFAGIITTPIAQALLGLFFGLNGVNVISMRLVSWYAMGWIGEYFAGFVPWLTIETIVFGVLSRIDDEKTAKKDVQRAAAQAKR
jgi:hypothetical protein